MGNQIQNQLLIYAIYDKKSGRYDTPFFSFDEIFAKRRYMLMANEEKSPLAMWPEDFELQEVGTFETESGKVVDTTKLVLDGREVKQKK